MVLRIAIILLALIHKYQAAPTDEVINQWQLFQIEFDKSYKSAVEAERRFEIFTESFEKIAAHNARYEQGLETYEQGLNSFSDWTAEEFLKFVSNDEYEHYIGGKVYTSDVALPKSIDWRKSGAVMEVKSQGQCQSCWAFAAAGALEGQLAIHRRINVSLSEQNLVDCVGSAYYCNGCNRGSRKGALKYIQDNGITLESLYPYTGTQGKCKNFKKKYTLKSIETAPSTEAGLQQLVGTKGPTTTGMEVTDNLRYYKSGIFYDSSCTKKTNHGVLAVGYGSENNSDFWIIKNSWGPNWGENGFFRIARNRGNHCGIATYPNVPSI